MCWKAQYSQPSDLIARPLYSLSTAEILYSSGLYSADSDRHRATVVLVVPHQAGPELQSVRALRPLPLHHSLGQHADLVTAGVLQRLVGEDSCGQRAARVNRIAKHKACRSRIEAHVCGVARHCGCVGARQLGGRVGVDHAGSIPQVVLLSVASLAGTKSGILTV